MLNICNLIKVKQLKQKFMKKMNKKNLFQILKAPTSKLAKIKYMRIVFSKCVAYKKIEMWQNRIYLLTDSSQLDSRGRRRMKKIVDGPLDREKKITQVSQESKQCVCHIYTKKKCVTRSISIYGKLWEVGNKKKLLQAMPWHY